jgi:hypothetical protein
LQELKSVPAKCAFIQRENTQTQKMPKKESQRKKVKKSLNLEQKEVSIILQASPIWLTDTTRP